MPGGGQLRVGAARRADKNAGAQLNLVSDKQPKIAWYKYVPNTAWGTLTLKVAYLGFSINGAPAFLCLGWRGLPGCATLRGVWFGAGSWSARWKMEPLRLSGGSQPSCWCSLGIGAQALPSPRQQHLGRPGIWVCSDFDATFWARGCSTLGLISETKERCCLLIRMNQREGWAALGSSGL